MRRENNTTDNQFLIQRSVHIIVKGRVQGVGYRWFVTQKAADFNIAGWVRNLPDRNVEIVAHGKKTDLDTFIEWIKTGPARARVISDSVSDFVANHVPDTFSVR